MSLIKHFLHPEILFIWEIKHNKREGERAIRRWIHRKGKEGKKDRGKREKRWREWERIQEYKGG